MSYVVSVSRHQASCNADGDDGRGYVGEHVDTTPCRAEALHGLKVKRQIVCELARISEC